MTSAPRAKSAILNDVRRKTCSKNSLHSFSTDLKVVAEDEGQGQVVGQVEGQGEGVDDGRRQRANKRIERGEIEPRRQTLDQAAVYVHKKFGHSKKFSQGDKNDLIRALAVKFEADRQEVRGDLKQTEENLAKEKLALQKRDMTSSAIVDSLTKFHRKYEPRLTTHAHGMESTSDFLLKMEELNSKSVAGLDLLIASFEEFLKRVDVIVYVSETLAKERDLSRKFLEAAGGNDVTKLGIDDVITKRLKSEGFEANDDDLDDVIAQLTSQISRLESTTEKKRYQVDEQRNRLEKAEKTIQELRKLEKPEKVPTKSHPRALWA